MEMPFFHPSHAEPIVDKLAERLRLIASTLMVITGGLLPLLFIPSIYIPFSSGKTAIVAVAAGLAILFYVLAVLREGKITFHFSLSLFGIWLVVLVAFVSALLSGDVRDAIFGNALDSYSASFLLLLAVVMTITATLVGHKQSIIKLYALLVFSSIVITLFHVLRLVFGPEVLSFGMFGSATTSPVGTWNGLAIFYNLVVLISIIALQQLPFSRAGRYISLGVVGISLVMLVIINFSVSWWVLAFVSGVMILNYLIRNAWKTDGVSDRENDSFAALATAVIIFAISLTLLIGGARIGSFVSERLGIAFIEVRPSAVATLNIAEAVYRDDLLLGSGPNRFVDAWRQYKDPSMNQTIFWNAPFDSGYSYLTTNFITTGLLGMLAWGIFLFGFITASIRFLFRTADADRFWYFIGLSSLVASAYMWLMSALYVPPPGILLLCAITTGVFIAAYSRLRPSQSFTFSANKGRAYGVFIVAMVVVIVSVTTFVFYSASREMLATHQFNKVMSTVSETDTLDVVDERILAVFDGVENDAFVRQIALHQWTRLRSILNMAEPGDMEREAFQRAAAKGIEAGELAVGLDATDPLNHQVLGQIYSALSVVGVEGANDRALQSFANAKRYDPQNPTLLLLEADLAMQKQDLASARMAAEEAVRLKYNYTEALFFLAQLDIAEGNVEEAIAIVEGLTQLEPQNPSRRYQLGILLAGAGNLDQAVKAFEEAVQLDPQYANARYFLALGYAEQGKVEEAIAELVIVRDLNESNSVVDTLITQLETEGRLENPLTELSPVTDRDPETSDVTEGDLDNDLVTSSNPVPADDSNEEEVVVE